MDDILLSNSDIEEIIDDVDIKEIVYSEEGRIRLTYDQIQSEIGNLLPASLPIFKLRNKTKLYTELFHQPEKIIPSLSSIHPIIKVKVPLVAPTTPPLTGASAAINPLLIKSSEKFLDSVGLIVELSIK